MREWPAEVQEVREMQRKRKPKLPVCVQWFLSLHSPDFGMSMEAVTVKAALHVTEVGSAAQKGEKKSQHVAQIYTEIF